MRHLTADEIIMLHDRVISHSGGSRGLRDRDALESAAAQSKMSFGGEDLYRTITEKAAALGYSLVNGHPFVDGNKRIGHAAMEMFLIFNNYNFTKPDDEQEQIMLGVASGLIGREAFARWVKESVQVLGV